MSNENKFVIPEGCKKLGNEEMSGVNGGWALVVSKDGMVGYLTHTELVALSKLGTNPFLPVQPPYNLPFLTKEMAMQYLPKDMGHGIKIAFKGLNVEGVSPIISKRDIEISKSNKIHFNK